MNQEAFIGRCQGPIDQGTKLPATKRPPSPNEVSDYSVDSGAFYEWKASGLSFVKMVFGDGYTHFRLFDGSVKHPYFNDALQGTGVLKAGCEELRGGFLGRVQDLVAAEIFTDFLEQAVHLLEAGYKDAAASVAGAELEDSLRRIALVQKVTGKTNDDLSSLNHKLADKQVYTRLVQKKIQVWNDTRNNAAHGNLTNIEWRT